MSSQSLKRRIMVSFLSAISFIIMYFEFPLPLFPTFLKFDFSAIPAFIGALAFGPVYGILIELLKSVLHYVIKGSLTGVPIGELSDFVASSSFVFVATWFYHKKKTLPSLMVGLVSGTLITSVIMTIANYLFFLPAYAWFLGYKLNDIIGMAQMTNNKIIDLQTLVLYAIAPFNIIKGTILSIVLIPFFQRLRTQLEQTFTYKSI